MACTKVAEAKGIEKDPRNEIVFSFSEFEEKKKAKIANKRVNNFDDYCEKYLTPDTTKPRTKNKCDCCELSYSNKYLQKLMDNYKLLYLNTYSTEVEYSLFYSLPRLFF